MRHHVHAEHRGHVPADTRRCGNEQEGTARQPGDGAPHGPRVTTSLEATDTHQVGNRENDGGRSEDEIEAPVEHQSLRGRRAIERIANGHLDR